MAGRFCSLKEAFSDVLHLDRTTPVPLSAQSPLSLLRLLLFVFYPPETRTEGPLLPPQFCQAALREDAPNSFC